MKNYMCNELIEYIEYNYLTHKDDNIDDSIKNKILNNYNQYVKDNDLSYDEQSLGVQIAKEFALYPSLNDDFHVLKTVCENRGAYVIEETLEECGKRIFEITYSISDKDLLSNINAFFDFESYVWSLDDWRYYSPNGKHAFILKDVL